MRERHMLYRKDRQPNESGIFFKQWIQQQQQQRQKGNQKIENSESLPYSIWIGPKCDL